MLCPWINITPSLQKGIAVINKLDQIKFEQFLRRILVKVITRDSEIFNTEEKQKLIKIFDVNEENLVLAIKTAAYLLNKTLKFIFMPIDLKNDLEGIKLDTEKVDTFVKVWSLETRNMLTDMSLEAINDRDNLNILWKLNAEVSSDCHTKCKIPKAYVNMTSLNNDMEIEFTHLDLYSVFLQFEAVQSEIDNIL